MIFLSAMYIAAAVNVKQRLIPAAKALHDAINEKAPEWKDIVKIGRTHMQDATPLTLGEEWSGYVGVLADDLDRIEAALPGVYRLALGGTAAHDFEPTRVAFCARLGLTWFAIAFASPGVPLIARVRAVG